MNFNKENIKQIILTILAIVFIFIGYFNYSLDVDVQEEKVAKVERNELTLGDVQLVNAEPSNIENGVVVSNEDLEIKNEIERNIGEVTKEDYYEETRLERNRMYSEMLEIYQDLIDSSETPQDQKAIAAQEISNINKRKNGIMISENLIKNKGFEDVVVLVNDNNVSVVVKSYTLNQEQISKIQNIIERELNIDIKNINISNKY